MLSGRVGKKSAAPPKLNDAKIIPEIEEVVTHHNDSKIEEILQEREPKAFMKHFRSVLERFEIPHECKTIILIYFFFSDRHWYQPPLWRLGSNEIAWKDWG